MPFSSPHLLHFFEVISAPIASSVRMYGVHTAIRSPENPASSSSVLHELGDPVIGDRGNYGKRDEK